MEKTLAAWSNYDDSIKMWNVQTGLLVKSIKGSSPLTFSPDGKIFASADGNTIKLWNATTGRLIKSIKGHTQIISSIAFSPDGKALASIQWRGDETLAPEKPLTSPQTYRPISFFAANNKLNSNSLEDENDSKTIKLWNITTGKQTKTFESADTVKSIAFSPDGKILASGNGEIVEIWNVKTGEQFESLYGSDGIVESVSFSPDGKTVVSGVTTIKSPFGR